MTERPERRQRLEILRDRFVAVSMRSRTLRLTRTSRSGALDLARLGDPTEPLASQKRLAWLVKVLGADEAPPGVIADVAASDAADAFALDLATLAHAARADRMETGAEDLAVGWPFIEGRAADGTWLRAPVFLYPVTLGQTDRGRLRWTLTPAGAPLLNEPLLQALARVANVRLTREDFLAHDEDGAFRVDEDTWQGVVTTLQLAGLPLADTPPTLPSLAPLEPRLADARDAQPLDRFRLCFHLVLGRFPAAASTIVLDYDALLAGPLDDTRLGLATTLLAVDEDATWSERPPPEPTAPPGPDDAAGTLRRWQALPSDASQDAVFRYLEAHDQGGLVVQGPPGTGKSQLITNLVAASVARGDRVLLVCQKRAALDVVVDRLTHIGLDDAVAVVHDVQRDRNAVCQRIADTLSRVLDDATTQATTLRGAIDKAATAHASAERRVAARLDATRAAFGLQTDGAGRPGLAELYERALDDDGGPVPDLRDLVAEVTEADLEGAAPIVDALATETAPYAAPHPLHRRASWAGYDDIALAGVFAQLTALGAAIGACDAARGEGHLSLADVDRLAALFVEGAPLIEVLASDATEDLGDFLLFWGWCGGDDAEQGQWATVMRRLERARAELEPVPAEIAALTEDARAAQRAELVALTELRERWWRFFSPRWWGLRRLPDRVRDGLSEPPPPEDDGVTALIGLHDAAGPWNDLIADMPSDSPFFDFGFRGDPAEIDDAIAKVRAHHDRVVAFHRLRARLAPFGGPYGDAPDLARLDADTLRAHPFARALAADARKGRILADLDRVLDGLAPHFDATWRQELRAAVVVGQELARDAVAAALAARPDAPGAARADGLTAEHPAWIGRFLRLRRPGPGQVASEQARRAVLWAWRMLALSGRERAVVEAPLVEREAIDALGAAVDSSRALTASGISARYHARLLDAAHDDRARQQLQKLAAEARKKRYRATLRQICERYWGDALTLARPAWFCSPESVAALFPLQAALFDLVIFDEASQCPVESAVPALVRTRRAVIAGDDQQMPPTHFFRSAYEDDVDEDDDTSLLASQSILDLARIALPNTTLSWHYRCRHEALIAFSNAAFYGRKLATAPNAEARPRLACEGLHWRRVDGLWQAQTNPVEAEAVVDAVRDILGERLPDGGPPSIGIVTFNKGQAELIERALEARAAVDEGFRGLVQRDRERSVIDQLFVRNLENVQGDERDVIVMSLGYGPTEPGGRTHARFGPLGQDGGEKRLNVAITRARLGLWMVTSIEPETLSVGQTKHPGPKLLASYLRYVRACSRGEEAAVDGCLAEAAALGGARGVAAKSLGFGGIGVGRRVRDAIAAALDRRGYQVRTGVGLGRLDLDVAVATYEADVFRVGVDTSGFLSEADAMTRDVYVPRFWERVGWRIVRVTPGMWVEDPDAVLRAIDAAVAAAYA